MATAHKLEAGAVKWMPYASGVLIIGILAAMHGCVSPNEPDNSGSDSNTYIDSERGVQISGIAGWTVTPDNQDPFIRCTITKDVYTDFQPRVTVSAEQWSGAMPDYPTYTSQITASMKADTALYDSIAIREETTRLIDGEVTGEIHVVAVYKGYTTRYEFRQNFDFRNGHVVVFTFLDIASRFAQTDTAFAEIRKTIQFN